MICRLHLIVWLLAAVVLAAGPADGLEIRVLSDGAEVTGASAGGEVAFLSVWREVNAQGGTEVTLLDKSLRDDDGDGQVSFSVADLERQIPELSVWIAVDVVTGEAAVATPGRFEPQMAEARFPGASGRVELEVSRPVALWVRPGVGAFLAHVRDGEGRDRDRAANGRVALGPADFTRPPGRPDQARAPGSRPGPPAFSAGDVVVGVDAGTMAVVALRIPGHAPGEAQP